MRLALSWLVVLAICSVGCDRKLNLLSRAPDGAELDAAVADEDATETIDAAADAEVVADAEPPMDAEPPDAEPPDAEPPDAEPPDAEPPDAEPPIDAGPQACIWDGVSPRVDQDCIGDRYEYFGPNCSWTWSRCAWFNGSGPPIPPAQTWVLECHPDAGGDIVCDCFDSGQFVNTIPAPADICPARPPGPIEGDLTIYQDFAQLGPQCLFCARPF